jgi:hypothetical protein
MQQCRAAVRHLLSERPLQAKQAMTEIATVDAGIAGVCAAQIGEAAVAARVDDSTHLIR